jgi:hypothetical protein
MNTTRSSAFFIIILLALTAVADIMAGEIKVIRKPHALAISNSVLVREIRFSENEPSAIEISSFALRPSGRELTRGDATVDWFEFFVNNVRVTNRDKRWVFEDHTSRTLDNGGLELRLRFKSVLEPLRSLRLEVVAQMFPGEMLFREKLAIMTEGTTLNLTAPSEGARLTFPAYAFQSGNKNEIKTLSVRLADWGRNLIESVNATTFDERTLEEGTRIGRNLSQNYMYHPSEVRKTIKASEEATSPGPVFFAMNSTDQLGIMTAYEHGAPDGDKEQEYVVMRRSLRVDGLRYQAEYRSGIYYDRQPITPDKRVESPWHVVGFFVGKNVDDGRALLWRYLDRYISESAASRIPHFYYNSWGMQRDEERRGKDVRLVLTKERVLSEIESASKLGVDLFVLDDGWQDRFGDWNPDLARYTNGLTWYIDALKKKNIMPGLWIATLATDSSAAITHQHPEWLIRDDSGKPIVARWGMNYFCFDSDYRDYFIKKCKERIDEGIRYFKWDGIDKHLCSSPNHHHGDASVPAGERRSKQGFDLPLLVTDAIRQLREYQSDVVVEVDVTEPHRSVGLAILSEGKYFWMNNGASGYGDYSTHRSKSNRFISNLYHQLIPPSLLTFANYPHNNTLYSSYRSNVNSSLTGGRGFWGNLALMNEAELARVGKAVAKSREVMYDIAHVRPVVTGGVGGSPEIYEWIDKKTASGQVIAFSGSALATQYNITNVPQEKILAVLNNAYSSRSSSLTLQFEFGWPEASREAFVLSNRGKGMSIVSSSSWIDGAEIVGDKTLRFTNGAPGKHVVLWNSVLGLPTVTADKEIAQRIQRVKKAGTVTIEIETRTPFTHIQITGQ